MGNLNNQLENKTTLKRFQVAINPISYHFCSFLLLLLTPENTCKKKTIRAVQNQNEYHRIGLILEAKK